MSVCMPFGLSHLRTGHLVSASEHCFECACVGFICTVCVFLKGQGVRIYLVCVSKISLILSPCVRFEYALFRLWRSHQDYLQQTITAHPAGPQQRKTFLHSLSGRIWRTHAHSLGHTLAYRHVHTAEAEAGGVCCITVRSSGCKHPPDLSNCQGCPLRVAESRAGGWGGGVIIGQVTLIMSLDLNICHGWSLDFSRFLFPSCQGRIRTLLCHEISCVATVCNSLTMTSWGETCLITWYRTSHV